MPRPPKGSDTCVLLPRGSGTDVLLPPRDSTLVLLPSPLGIYTYVYFQVVVHLYYPPHGGTYVLRGTLVLPYGGRVGSSILIKGNGKLC